MLDSSGKGFQTAIHAIEQGKFAPLLRALAGVVVLLTVALLYIFVQFTGFDSPDAMDRRRFPARCFRRGIFNEIHPSARALAVQSRGEADSRPRTFPISISRRSGRGGNDPAPARKGALEDDAEGHHLCGRPRRGDFLGPALPRGRDGRLFHRATTLRRTARATGGARRHRHRPAVEILALGPAADVGAPVADGLRVVHSQGDGEQEEAPNAPPLKKWLLQAAIGVLFGAMTLSHWAACWLFFGYLFFAFFYFKPRVLPLAAVVTFALALTPWIVRNVAVCGHPFGLALYPLSTICSCARSRRTSVTSSTAFA